MKKLSKKLSLACLSLTALCSFTVGALCWNHVSVAVAEESFNPQTSMVMLSGANLRKDAANPSLKFTAEISDYDVAYDYGMLIIPATWLETYTFNNDYIDVLNAEVGVGGYSNVICKPYQDVEENGTAEAPGAWRISSAIKESASNDYSVEYIAIAYVTDGVDYKYASFDLDDNARSFMYVAQMAVKNDANLTDEEIASLEQYIYYDSEMEINVSDYLVYDAENNTYDLSQMTLTGSTALETGENKVLSMNLNDIGFDAGELSIHTKDYYFQVTQVSFKAKFDAKQDEDHGGNYGWWGINYFEDYAAADIYSNMLTVQRSTENNDWETITITPETPFDGYISIIGAVKEFLNPTILIDDFTIMSEGDVYVEDFNNVSLSADDEGMFVKKDDSEIGITYKNEPGITIAASPNVATMTISNVIESLDAIRSKNAYSNISNISFDICVSGGSSNWGGFQMGYATGSAWDVGRVYEHFNGENVNFVGGYIDYLTQLNKNVTYHAEIDVADKSITATFTSENGDVKNVTGSLSDTKGLYLAFFHEVKGDGSYTISNFEITSSAGVESGVANIFTGGEDVTMAESIDESYNFANILSADVAQYMAKGNYAALKGTEIYNYSIMPDSAVVLTTKINYALVGEKEFAIVVGGTASAPEYLYVNNSSVSYYKGAAKIGESVALTEEINTLIISITAAKELFVSVNGSVDCLGVISDYTALKLVGMGGQGTVRFNCIESYKYNAGAEVTVEETQYALYTTDGTFDGLSVVGNTASYAEGDTVLTIDLKQAVGCEGAKMAFVTKNKHEFKSLSFDIYVPKFSAKQSGKWLGDFAFGATLADNYSGTGILDDLIKGAWNHIDITVENGTATLASGSRTWSVPAGNNYFYIRINPGDGIVDGVPFADNDIIKLNNFTITDSTGTYTDTFDDGTTSLLTPEYSLASAFGFEKYDSTLQLSDSKTPAMLGVLANAVGAHEVIAVALKDTYSNVSELSFKAKYDDTVLKTDRWGLGISTSKGSYTSCYSAQSFEFPMDNAWHEYRFVFTESGMQMYLDGTDRGTLSDYNNTTAYQFYLVICPKSSIEAEDVLVYMDDFSITADGTTYTDDFSQGAGAGLFHKADGKRELQSICESGNGNSIENIASIINGLDSYISGAEYELSDLRDSLKGTISYTMDSDKEFVVILGEDAATSSADFLYITSSQISFCKVVNGELQIVDTVVASANNTIELTLTKAGVLSLGDGVTTTEMGTVSNICPLKIADVNQGGNVTFTNIDLKVQKFVQK